MEKEDEDEDDDADGNGGYANMKDPKGQYLYDVHNSLIFFYPLSPPCQVQKSADFVPCVCLVGTPLPPHSADII